MQMLRILALALKPYGRQAMFYLAAAVSDFYIPWSHLVSSTCSFHATTAWFVSNWKPHVVPLPRP